MKICRILTILLTILAIPTIPTKNSWAQTVWRAVEQGDFDTDVEIDYELDNGDPDPTESAESKPATPSVPTPELMEGSVTSDGRVLILLSRRELDLANALLESEKNCRDQLMKNSAVGSSPKSTVNWWLQSAIIVGAFLTGGLAGFAIAHLTP